jgi:hypothetical protein
VPDEPPLGYRVDAMPDSEIPLDGIVASFGRRGD